MLTHTAIVGLLPERLDDAPLCNFPPASLLVILRETVSALREAKPDVFATPSQVEHALRTVGHAFGLPLTAGNQLEVMQSALKLYKTWALDEKKRPKPLSQNESAHLQTMMRHLSQLFKWRGQLDADTAAEHVKLCEGALNIYAVLASQGDRLDADTWKTLMLTLLGVADYLWTALKSTPEKAFAAALSERVGYILFESWILSSREDAVLWSRLAKLFPGWCHVMSVVITWKGVCVALTQRVLNLLYGPTEGLPFVKLSIAPKARIDGKFVYYAWSRYLNLLGNLLESTASPETFLEVFVAVREMVGLFLGVGRESVKMKLRQEDANSTDQTLLAATAAGGKSVSAVNGNTLLQLFGKFIFDAVISNVPARHLGTSLATQIMCDIFVVCSANTSFQRAHLARFYTALSRILLNPEPEISSTLVAVLHYCGSLFTYGLPGSHILIPTFVFAVSRVLTCRKNVSDTILAADVRHYALSILSTLLCLPEHFQAAPLYPAVLNGASKPGVLGVKSYKDLNQHYKELISRTVSSSATDFQEDDSDNVNLLLWIHFVHGSQSTKFDDLLTLCNRILSNSSYSVENVLTALKCISCLTNFILSGLGVRCTKTVLDFVTREMRNPSSDSSRFVVTSAIYTLCDWVVCDRRVLEEKNMLDNISSAVMSILTNDAEIKTLREAARYLLISLINNHGQWPPAPGNLSLSCALTESNVLSGNNTARYFCLEGVGFVTVVERRDLPDTVTIILRDKKGRWVYNMSLAQIDASQQTRTAPPAVPPAVVHVVLSEPSPTEAEAAAALERIRSIYAFFRSKNMQHPLISPPPTKQLPKQQEESNGKLPEPIAPPSRPATSGSLFRLALSNLGMLSLHQKERFHSVDQTMDFYRELKQLDLTSEREGQRVGVCFVPSGVKSVDGTFMTKHVSADYLRFLSSLGWGYNIKENRQNLYTGNADDPAYGAEVLPYYSNYSSEMIFFPMHLFNCSLELKQKLMNTAMVAIIYCEDLDGYNPALFKSNRAHIVVNPLSTPGLYHVSFFNTPQKRGFDSLHYAIGPISDKMVLSQSLLASMVRITASNACRTFQPPAQFNTRQTKIASMIERHARPLAPGEFYSLLFKDLPEDQLPPPIRMSTREVLATPSKNDSVDFKSPRGEPSAKSPRPVSEPSFPPTLPSEPVKVVAAPSPIEPPRRPSKEDDSKVAQQVRPPMPPVPAVPVEQARPSLPSVPVAVVEPMMIADVPLQQQMLATRVKTGSGVLSGTPPLPSSQSPGSKTTTPRSSGSTPLRPSGGVPMPGGKAAGVGGGGPPLPTGSPMASRKVGVPPMPGSASGTMPTVAPGAPAMPSGVPPMPVSGSGVSPMKRPAAPEPETPAAPLLKKTIRLPEGAGRAKRPPMTGRGAGAAGNE